MAKRTFRRAREVLNELKWREGNDIERAEIWYADRNAPTGHKVIHGGEVTETGRGYFSTIESMLPYYKILRIECEGKVLFERPEHILKGTSTSPARSRLQREH